MTSPAPSYRRALVILGLAVFVSMCGVGIIVPFLPIYARELGASGVLMGLIFSSFSLSRGLVVPLVGGLSDRIGRKPFIILGQAGYAAVAILFIYTASPFGLVMDRLLQGVFAAMVLPIAMALVADAAPLGMEGRVFGGFNMFFLMGFGVGPLIGGAVYEYAGLNANFWLMAGLSLASLAAVALFVKEPPKEQRSGGKRGFREMWGLAQDRTFAAVLVARLGAAVGMSCFIAFMPVIATDHGLGNLQVGACLTANVVVMTLLQKPFGRLADKTSRLGLAVVGQMASGAMKMLIPFGTDFFWLMLLSMAEGVFAGMALPAMTALAISRGKALGQGMGLVTGSFTMALSVGVFFGPVTGGWVVDLTGHSAAALWLGGGTAVLTGLIMFLLGRGADIPPLEAAEELAPVERILKG
ncbi:MAG: MFS transporter [Desulfarculaceae bacterium]|nr:MFS transporter [Desulfarculaceae bacterium]